MSKSTVPTKTTVSPTLGAVKKNGQEDSRSKVQDDRRDRQKRPPPGPRYPISDELRGALKAEVRRRGRGGVNSIAADLAKRLKGYEVHYSLISQIANGTLKHSHVAPALAEMLGVVSRTSPPERVREELEVFEVLSDVDPVLYGKLMQQAIEALDNHARNQLEAVERIQKLRRKAGR